ncbi:MAG: hypothetical protein H0X45_16850 [Planctomycetes bacterium]|nr:hypothetical protein [Planctomycetota bacterium]
MNFNGFVKRSRMMTDCLRRAPVLYGKARTQLEAMSQAALPERRAFTDSRLRTILASAGRTAYGRRHAGSPIASWPMLDKQDLRGHEQDLLSQWHWPRMKNRTSGTTGTPLTVYRSLSSIATEQACIDLTIARRGLDARDMRMAVLRGDAIKPPDDRSPPFWTECEGGRVLILSSAHLTAETLPAYIGKLKSFAPDCLFAYPSSLTALCALLDHAGERLSVPLALTSSEVLDPATVALAKAMLGCRFADFYGQAERVAYAESFDDGSYRFVPGYALVELHFSRHEDDEALYDIVGTSLWNTLMPLVRFRTGDLISVPKGTGAGELDAIAYGMRPFIRIYGRDDGIYIHGPNGSRIYGVPKILNGIKHVYQSQIIQPTYDQVIISVVPAKGFSDDDRAAIIANARTKIPHAIGVSVTTCQRLETTKAGKTPFVIRRMTPSPSAMADSTPVPA